MQNFEGFDGAFAVPGCSESLCCSGSLSPSEEMGTSSQSDLPNVKPMSNAQAPLVPIAIVTSHSRPRRSATIPPHMQPTPPMAIAQNATSAASASRFVPAGTPDAKIGRAHV